MEQKWLAIYESGNGFKIARNNGTRLPSFKIDTKRVSAMPQSRRRWFLGKSVFLEDLNRISVLPKNQMDEREKIRMKKREQLEEQYLKGGKTMREDWPNAPLNITDANIDVHIKNYHTMVIDCWAPWCGPCRMVGPIIEELAKEMHGKMVFGKLNVDENPETSIKHQIMSIPTLLVFKNGKLVDRLVGAMPKEMLKQKLEQYQ
jgi:thioredoxin 1